jgi:hypothetical protein
MTMPWTLHRWQAEALPLVVDLLDIARMGL